MNDVIFFSHVIPLLWLWLKSIHFKIENALSELKGQIIILRVGTYLLFYSTTTVKQCFHSQKYGQKITGSTTETNWKSVYWLEKKIGLLHYFFQLQYTVPSYFFVIYGKVFQKLDDDLHRLSKWLYHGNFMHNWFCIEANRFSPL